MADKSFVCAEALGPIALAVAHDGQLWLRFGMPGGSSAAAADDTGWDDAGAKLTLMRWSDAAQTTSSPSMGSQPKVPLTYFSELYSN